MRVPAGPLPPVRGVLLGSVLHRKPWRYDKVDESVHEGSEEHLVYMLGQHGQVEPFSEGPDPFAEGRNGRYKEGVLHGYGAAEAFDLELWNASIDEGWRRQWETGGVHCAHTRGRADLINRQKPSVTFGDSASLGSGRESGQAHDQVTQVGNDVRSRGSESVGNCTRLWMSGLQRLEARPVLSAWVIRRLKRCRMSL